VRLVERVLTPFNNGELRAACREAWRVVVGGEAPDAAIACLSGQGALECAHGKACSNNNVGNVMALGDYAGDYFLLRAPECGDPDDLPAGATVLEASQIACAADRVACLSGIGSRFRSYATLLEGCIDKLRRFAAQWPGALAALRTARDASAAYSFVAGLVPVDGDRYFTADAAAYAATIFSLATDFLAEMQAQKVPMIEAHLPTNMNASRRNVNARAYRLFEIDMPVHDGTPESTVRIITWLGVERHERWRPGKGVTCCNIYAHDLCGLLGAYVPRVFWLPAALAEIRRGKQTSVRYSATVGEQNANMLFAWLVKWGAEFGWRRTTLDEAQAVANGGCAAVICARRSDLSQPGHISVVAPESDRCRALRDARGLVVRPVQSQAGDRNVELGTLERAWWTNPEMAEWGAWVYEPAMLRDTDPAPSPSSAPDTQPQTPTSKSSQSMRAQAATPIRAGEGEHTPLHLRESDDPESGGAS